MDYQKLKLIHIMVLLSLIKYFFAILGGFVVVGLSYDIGHTWYAYNTDPKEHDWDKQVKNTVDCEKCFFLAAIIFGIASYFHFVLLNARHHYQKHIRKTKRSQDCQVGSVPASFIDKKDKKLIDKKDKKLIDKKDKKLIDTKDKKKTAMPDIVLNIL